MQAKYVSDGLVQSTQSMRGSYRTRKCTSNLAHAGTLDHCSFHEIVGENVASMGTFCTRFPATIHAGCTGGSQEGVEALHAALVPFTPSYSTTKYHPYRTVGMRPNPIPGVAAERCDNKSFSECEPNKTETERKSFSILADENEAYGTSELPAPKKKRWSIEEQTKQKPLNGALPPPGMLAQRGRNLSIRSETARGWLGNTIFSPRWGKLPPRLLAELRKAMSKGT